MAPVVSLLPLLPLLAACAADPATPEPPAPPPPGTVELVMRVPVEAGAEAQWCRYLQAPAGGIDVARFEHRYTPGSHHLLLYETDLTIDEARADAEIFDCLARDDLRVTGMVYGGQEPEGRVEYPDGVAYHIPEERVLLLQTHYLNAGDQPLEAEIRVTLHPAKGEVTAHAGSLFYYDPFIVVPPGGEFTARMRCVVPDEITVMAAAPHMHRRGVAFRSWMVAGEARDEMHMSGDWTEIEPSVFSPGRVIAAGDTIEYECDFQSDRAEPVVQGPSAERDEMCMLIATYWPRVDVDAERCMSSGSGAILDGTKTCLEALSCAQGAGEDDAVRQGCFLDTCAGSRDAANAFIWCVFQRCAPCLDGDASCQGCVIEQCGAEVDACAAATCG